VLNEIKSQLSLRDSDSLKKITSEAVTKLEDISQLIQKTLDKQISMVSNEDKQTEEILTRLDAILKIMGSDEESRTTKRKKYLVIRRNND
jgi:hypothetical protein